MDKFYAKMKTLENEDLIKVLNLRDEYQPKAVEAAEQVLKERNISTDTINNVSAKIQQEKILKTKKKKERQDIVKNLISFSSLLTVGYGTNLEEGQIKKFRLFVIGLIGYYILFLFFNLPSYIQYIRFSETEFILGISIEMVLYGLVFPYGIYQFAKLKQKGWIIILYLFMNKLSLNVFGLVYMIKYLFLNNFSSSSSSLLDGLIPQPNYALSIIIALAFGAIIWFLLRKSILKIFNVTKEKKIGHLLGAVLFTVIFYLVTLSLFI